ncbi:hypothetical protein [Epilithonimonas arachidiradicis]|uniref:Uncharacterized protein n=1 Tax=Epilithonimonas arachidiradicis TaxID=1617282 RepID=A0A420CPU1_9FLAO|nr:hypothetical protein [Epilithonimonas arachidiradicis]RKE80388.1 hypothetical protein BXY58_2910 [Epilithonimonas arachidiradicis]GGG64063.1 hypothetical protein GCM10007332_27940 [Epilithonimonas arachidiradicis]
MDLDNLKSLWNKEDVSETPEISTERQKEIHLPLEKIRKNMRNEFWSTIILLPIVLIAIWFFNIPFRFRLYIEVLVASMTLVTVFFFSKFFKLYREINNPTLGTYDSLKDLFHQFELNKQYYLSFYLSFVPFFVCEIIIITESIPYSHQYTDGLLAVKFIISILFGLFALYFLGNWWFQHFYGKYIDKIKKLVEDLK